MLRFYCPSCQNELFFNSFDCVNCGTGVTYSPWDSSFVERDPETDCANRNQHQICNWRMDGEGPFCMACLANEVIPDLNVHGNREK